jgi:hypothetical protein
MGGTVRFWRILLKNSATRTAMAGLEVTLLDASRPIPGQHAYSNQR